MDLHTISVRRLGELLARKEVGSEELTRSYLERISQVEDKTKAFITVTEEEALAQARAVDEQRVRGEELCPWREFPWLLPTIFVQRE